MEPEADPSAPLHGDSRLMRFCARDGCFHEPVFIRSCRCHAPFAEQANIL
jgi:hypothetical protein